MTVTRRDFFKISGAVGAGLALSSLGVNLQPVKAYAEELKKTSQWATDIGNLLANGETQAKHIGLRLLRGRLRTAMQHRLKDQQNHKHRGRP